MADVKANDRDFTILFLVMLTTGAGNTALQSVLPTIGRTMGVADSVIAAAFSVSAAIWVVTAPIWARRSDRDGRREMVLIGLGGFVGSVALCGLILTAGLHGWIGPVLTMVCFVGARMLHRQWLRCGQRGRTAPRR